MKHPSSFVAAMLDQFLKGEIPLGEKLLADYKSYYGFIPEKGMYGPFAKPFLRPATLAHALDVSLRTLERSRLEGGGPPYIKVGKQIRYPIVELDDWVRKNLMQHG